MTEARINRGRRGRRVGDSVVHELRNHSKTPCFRGDAVSLKLIPCPAT